MPKIEMMTAIKMRVLRQLVHRWLSHEELLEPALRTGCSCRQGRCCTRCVDRATWRDARRRHGRLDYGRSSDSDQRVVQYGDEIVEWLGVVREAVPEERDNDQTKGEQRIYADVSGQLT